MTETQSFAGFAAEVRGQVEQRLVELFLRETSRARALSEDTRAIAEAVESLTMRGGKRQRAALAVLGHRLAGRSDDALAMPGAVSMELLQTYLLIHDDWMDGDETRRGGPSVHMMMRAHFDGDTQRGDAFAILAGDLACSLSCDALLAADDPRLARDAARELSRMTRDVVLGQALDVSGRPSDLHQMYDLKTSSYTVRGPLLVGAALGGATPALMDALAALAGPLGVAFQMADDLLGLFGDERTGKPRGNDLREGKRTSVIVAAEPLLDADGLLTIERGRGRVAAKADLDAALRLLSDCGAEAAVRAQIRATVAAGASAIDELDAPVDAKRLLSEAAIALTERAS